MCPVHVVQPDADGSSVSLKLFDLGKLHYRSTYVSQTLSSEVRAGDVLEVRCKVDA